MLATEPERRYWEIWSEGYYLSGEHARARLWGEVVATSFREACARIAVRNAEFAKLYDKDELRWFNCRLYDNERDARKAFG